MHGNKVHEGECMGTRHEDERICVRVSAFEQGHEGECMETRHEDDCI